MKQSLCWEDERLRVESASEACVGWGRDGQDWEFQLAREGKGGRDLWALTGA